jgi:hypothetical protein
VQGQLHQPPRGALNWLQDDVLAFLAAARPGPLGFYASIDLQPGNKADNPAFRLPPADLSDCSVCSAETSI